MKLISLVEQEQTNKTICICKIPSHLIKVKIPNCVY